MRPALADDAVLCTDGSGMLAKVANDLGIEAPRREHPATRAHPGCLAHPKRQRVPLSIQAMDGLLQRGGHRYLPNYLGWFRALDRTAQSGAKLASLLALAVDC